MSHLNYFYQSNLPNVIVSSLDNIEQSLPTNITQFVNIVSTGKNYTTPRTDQYTQGSQLLQNQIIANKFEFFDPASSENVQWQSVVHNQPEAITTTWSNTNPNEQIYPSIVIMPNNNHVLPQYLDPYFRPKPCLLENYQDDAHVDKKKVKKRLYDEMVDSFVKSNLESLKKCKNKEKHINCNKEVVSPKKKIEIHKKKQSPKKIVTPKKPAPLKKMSPKRKIFSDSLISKSETKSTTLTGKQERPTSWASKYLQSIGQDKQIINDVKSRKKLFQDTKLSKDCKLDDKPAVKTASITVKCQGNVKDLRTENVKKTLNKIKKVIKKNEKKILEAENKKKIVKAVSPNKHKKKELNSNIDSNPAITISRKNKNSVIAENIKILQDDNTKANISKGNSNLKDKKNLQFPMNVSTKMCNKTYSTPNSLMRSSIVKVPPKAQYKNETQRCKIVEDLRTILDDKKNVRKHCQQIRESKTKTFNLPIKKATTKIAEQRQPINKIKLIINIVHGDQQAPSHSGETSSPNDSQEDLSFLDDLDINVLIDGLNDCNNKQDYKEDKDNTQEGDYFKSLEKENRRCFENDLKLASKQTENYFTECAIEEKLASIFSERSKLISPEPSHKGNCNNDHFTKGNLDGSKKEVDSVNYDNYNELSGHLKHVFKNFNTKNTPNSLQNSYKMTLNVESMIAQIHGEEVLIPPGEPLSHEPPSQLELTTENKTVSENSKKTKFSEDSAHDDKILKENVVTPIDDSKREKNDENQSNEVVKTEEVTDIKECITGLNVLDNIQEIQSNSFQQLEVVEQKLVIPKTCSIKDNTEHKYNPHGHDNFLVDRSTEHLKLNIPESSNETSLNVEVAIVTHKDNTKDDVIKKNIHTTTNEPTTSTHKIEPNIYICTEDRLLMKELEARMLSYLQEEYKIINKIHEGGFSSVYRCINADHQQFAVKVLKTTKKVINFGFERERMMLKYQNDVPKENLHCVYLVNSFGLSKSQWGFLMEYCPRNVQQYLLAAGSFHIDVIQQLAKQLIGAVNMLRNYNIVHADIRPNHILINEEGNRIKLCGFDRSYYTDPPGLLPNIGTSNYRAPEVILGYSASFSIDVWSIAVVLYEMATGSKLFPGQYNNDILFKQMCLCGNMPIHMISRARYATNHFQNSIFMRRIGMRGQTRVPVKHFRNDQKLGFWLYNAYVKDWLKTRSDSQINKDSAKLQELQRLIEQMLQIDPMKRQTIEFIFSNPFIYHS